MKTSVVTVKGQAEIFLSLREEGRRRADEVNYLISTLPIQIDPADLELAKQAASIGKPRRDLAGSDAPAVLQPLPNGRGGQKFGAIAMDAHILEYQGAKVEIPAGNAPPGEESRHGMRISGQRTECGQLLRARTQPNAF